MCTKKRKDNPLGNKTSPCQLHPFSKSTPQHEDTLSHQPPLSHLTHKAAPRETQEDPSTPREIQQNLLSRLAPHLPSTNGS